MRTEEKILPHTYLVFKLGDHAFGFEACFLWEVANGTAMTEVPKSSDFLIGVAQVHGKIVPVVDLAGLLGLAQPVAGQAGGFVVVGLPGPKPVLAGFYVQEVSGFTRITPEEVKPLPAARDGVYIPFLSGERRDERGESTLLIQMDRLIASQSRGRTREGSPETVQASPA